MMHVKKKSVHKNTSARMTCYEGNDRSLHVSCWGIFIFLVLCILPGCGALIDWSKDAMYQGKAKNQALEQARMALRSVTVYDQFELLGKFDALWLSDSVCDSFARAYATKWGKGAQHTKEFIARQHAENKRTISFYVLYPFDLVPLGFPESFWSVSLCVDGDMRTIYAPLEIRMLDVAPEYQIIFGSLYTRFKQAYLIKFDAMARNDVSLITAHTKRIALVFRSVKKEVFLEWQLSDDNLAAHKRKSSSARRSASWAEEEVYGSGHESKGGKNVRRHAKR